MIWIVLAGYILGWPVASRIMYVLTAPDDRNTDEEFDTAMSCLLWGTIWPAILIALTVFTPGYVVFRLATRPTRRQREVERQKEKQCVADLARQHELPMGDL